MAIQKQKVAYETETIEATPTACKSARGDEWLNDKTQLLVDIEKTNASIQEADNNMRNMMIWLDQDRMQIEPEFETKKKEMNNLMTEIKVKKCISYGPSFTNTVNATF